MSLGSEHLSKCRCGCEAIVDTYHGDFHGLMTNMGWRFDGIQWVCRECLELNARMLRDNPLIKPLNAHYKHGTIDPCQYVEAMGDAEYRGACILNILKYITRYPHKGTPMEDLMKAQDYVNMLIEHQKKKESKP